MSWWDNLSEMIAFVLTVAVACLGMLAIGATLMLFYLMAVSL